MTFTLATSVFTMGTGAPSPAPNSWAANPENEVAIWNIHMDADAEFILPASKTKVSRNLYFYEGTEVGIDDRKVTLNHGVDLHSQHEVVIKTGSDSAHFILLQGKPINEPVAKYGPFVMNTDTEIQQAMDEYRLTQFGGWPWPYPDNVHPKEKGRFAQYPDGTLVEK
ncbi:MAG: pirin-like C-terminal cupin domain-containing protein [Bacteroidota bacterium]